MPQFARQRGCLLGLACGDAVGTTVEFATRGSFAPMTDMIGGGPFRLPAGAWTDDTSMALCLGASLDESQAFDPNDQMERYLSWRDDGYLSSNGRCFDIGLTTSRALENFRASRDPFSGPTHSHSAGNGSIMRLAAVPIFFYPNADEAVRLAGESSRTTHGTLECIEACRLMAAMLCKAFAGASKAEMLFDHDENTFTAPAVREIARGDYRDKGEDDIRGSGYVIRSLEAAAWCLLRTENFRDAVLRAVNLGEDADTTGAVVGQLAGAYYGEAAIPAGWLEKLVMRDEIRSLADRLARRGA